MSGTVKVALVLLVISLSCLFVICAPALRDSTSAHGFVLYANVGGNTAAPTKGGGHPASDTSTFQ